MSPNERDMNDGKSETATNWTRRNCGGCGRTLYLAAVENGVPAWAYAGGALIHDEATCVRAHADSKLTDFPSVQRPKHARRGRGHPKVLPSRNYGERRTKWRARVGVL